MPISHKHKFIFFHIPKTGGSTIESIFSDCKKEYFDENVLGAQQHFTSQKLKEKISPKIYQEYFKFCFVRNPFDRLVSEYFYNQEFGYRKHRTFIEFVECAKDIVENKKFYEIPFGDHFIPQIEYIQDVDKIYRFENYIENVEELLQKYGKIGKTIPHKAKTNHDHYRTYYDDYTRSIVEDIYAEDLKQLEYFF